MRYYIGTPPFSPYLEHHGILGMRWGVRRYQNEDGSLTEEGKARYGYGSLSKNADYSDPKKLAKAQKGYRAAYNNNWLAINKRTTDAVNNATKKFNKHWEKVDIADVDEWNNAYTNAYYEVIDAFHAINVMKILGAVPGSNEEALMKEAQNILKKNGILDD